MERLVGKCGFVCEDCPAYSKNINSEADREEVSRKWLEIFQYPIDPAEIRCDGCVRVPGEGHEMLHGDCEFRACADGRGLDHCGLCPEYPCEKLEGYLSAYEQVARDWGDRISAADRDKYLKPHLDARTALKE